MAEESIITKIRNILTILKIFKIPTVSKIPTLPLLPRDILVNCVIPYVSYFALETTLLSLNFTREEIIKIKATEHAKRLIECNADHITAYVNIHQIEYRIDGIIHREDGPARIVGTGDDRNYYWYMHGKIHRENGPAMVYSNGTTVWLKNGKYHRDDGPAYEGFDGYLEWYINGKHHRLSGPATVYANGAKEFWINDSIQYIIKENGVYLGAR